MITNKVKYNHKITTRTKKTTIVIHGTGGGTVDSAITSFQPDGVSVPFVIDRSGLIYQLYDESFDHWHAGSNFRGISKKSIGIELVNWNHLSCKDGKCYTWTGKEIHPDEIMHTSGWRGSLFFHKVTKEQHKALCELLNFLCDKHDIKKELIRQYKPELIKKDSFSGIVLHSSFHPQKMDFYPDLLPKIIL